MDIEIKKQIALAQHLDQDYFVLENEEGENEYFLGEEEEAQKEYDEYKEGWDEADVLSFIDHCRNECELLGDWFSNEEDSYEILTDSEADEKYDEYMDSLIEEVISEIPRHLRQYFNTEKYKDDHSYDGRGCIASYDGNEWEEYVEDETIFLYKIA